MADQTAIPDPLPDHAVSAKPQAAIVSGWWKKYTVWLAALGLALPDLLQWAVDNLDFLGLVGAMTPETKATMRTVILALIPLAAAWKQKVVPPK